MADNNVSSHDNIDKRDYAELTYALENIYEHVYKRYYQNIDTYSVMNPTNEINNNSILNRTQFFKIDKIEFAKGEMILDKLSTVIMTATSLGNSLAIIIESLATGEIGYYIGVINRSSENIDLCAKVLENAFTSHFPGSEMNPISKQKLNILIENTFERNRKRTISAVSGLNVERTEEREQKTHAIDRFLSTMRSKVYTAVFIIDPLSKDDCEELLNGYQALYSDLSPFAKSVWNYNESTGKATLSNLTKGISTNITESIGKQRGYTLSHTDNTFNSTTAGVNVQLGTQSGHNHQQSYSHSNGTSKTLSIPIGSILKVAINAACIGSIALTGGSSTPIATTIMAGVNSPTVDSALKNLNSSKGKSESWASTVADGISKSISGSIGGNLSRTSGTGQADTVAENYGINQIIGETKGEVEQTTEGTQLSENEGKSLQIEYVNREITDLLEMLDKQIGRINESRDYGLYNLGAYFISPMEENSILAANVYKSIKQGVDSSCENLVVNTWNERKSPEYFSVIKKYLKNLTQPVFFKHLRIDKEDYLQFLPISAGSVVSGKQVPVLVDIPQRSVNGLTIDEYVDFGHNIKEDRNGVMLGNIIEYGTYSHSISLDADMLTSHTFITGSTGSGKTNTICQILDALSDNKTKFLVVEPAKGEYKDKLGGREDVFVYGTNPNLTQMLRINPFSFPTESIHILEHMDRLVEIFNVCWPMYAAMPAILKEAIEDAYEEAGWDLVESKNRFGINLFPSFSDVCRHVERVVAESAYSADNKSDYVGALVTRIHSLTNGLNGIIFSNDELSNEDLFEKNVIVDLSRAGSTETKALIMGMLILKLQEHRMNQGLPYNSALTHITVLEEAHNLLKRTSTEQANESTNLLGKSVEMLANSIAEMRAYGEGFVIADQSPGLLDMSVIRNTNTKIIMRLPALSDRELVGKSAGLNDDQIVELGKLETGVAAVMQSGWQEAILCKVNKHISKTYKNLNKISAPTNTVKSIVIDSLINRNLTHMFDRPDVQILKADVSVKVKLTLLNHKPIPSKVPKIACEIAYELFDGYKLNNVFSQNLTIESKEQLILQNIKKTCPNISQRDLYKLLSYIFGWYYEITQNAEALNIAKRYTETIQ